MPTIVRATRDMRPWQKGEDRVLPDDLAAKLVKDGDAEDPRPFPPADVAPRPPAKAPRPRRYMTREADRA
jgi:hypothetical protein